MKYIGQDSTDKGIVIRQFLSSQLQDALEQKAPKQHTHTSDDITDGVDMISGSRSNAGKVVKVNPDGSIALSYTPGHAHHVPNKKYVDDSIRSSLEDHTIDINQVNDLQGKLNELEQNQIKTWTGTEEEYNRIAVKDDKTIYFVRE